MGKVSRQGKYEVKGVKSPCVVSTSENITLSGLQTIGVTAVVAGERVLVRSQSDNTENGIYDVSASAWTRSVDFNTGGDVISGVGILDIANGTLYFTDFSGAYVAGTTAMTITDQVPPAIIGGITLGSGNAVLTQSSTTKTFSGDVVITGTRPGSWGAEGVYLNNADYVRFPIYANKAALDVAFTAAGVSYEAGMIVYSTANLIHVYYNGTNWVQIDDDSTVML